jgi:hypothetical protein
MDRASRADECDTVVGLCFGERCRSSDGGAEALLTKPIDFGVLRGEIDERVERAA